MMMMMMMTMMMIMMMMTMMPKEFMIEISGLKLNLN